MGVQGSGRVISRRAVLAAAGLILARPVLAQGGLPAMTPATDLPWSYLADHRHGRRLGRQRSDRGWRAASVRHGVDGQPRRLHPGPKPRFPRACPPPRPPLRLRVRGNGERYFVHLRTTRNATAVAILPARVPDRAGLVRGDPAAGRVRRVGSPAVGAPCAREEIRSIGIAAYGRDHAADLWLQALGAV